MNKIPTIEECLVQNEVFYKPEIGDFNLIIHRDCYIRAQKNIKNAMIEFAKLHIEAALKEASEKVFAQSTNSNISSKDNQLTCIHLGKVYVNKNSILNAYPLENIK